MSELNAAAMEGFLFASSARKDAGGVIAAIVTRMIHCLKLRQRKKFRLCELI